MVTFRKIYEIEEFTVYRKLIMRRFVANKKTDERIARPYGDAADIRLVGKDEHYWIKADDIERL